MLAPKIVSLHGEDDFFYLISFSEFGYFNFLYFHCN